MPRIVRGQVAQEVGDRLQELGRKASKLDQYRGDALAFQIELILSAINSERHRLATLLRSCRAAKNSYPNYPALRRAIGEAGDRVYEIADQLEGAEDALREGKWLDASARLLRLGQEIKLVSFVPPEGGGEAQVHTA